MLSIIKVYTVSLISGCVINYVAIGGEYCVLHFL